MHFDSGALYQRSRESENQVELNFTILIIIVLGQENINLISIE